MKSSLQLLALTTVGMLKDFLEVEKVRKQLEVDAVVLRCPLKFLLDFLKES